MVERDPASFRDPSGFVFRRDGVIYRQVQARFTADWEALSSSGLLERLIDERLLVAHESASLDLAVEPGAVAVIRPEPIPFLTFPYEWSFGQLKDAALLTLHAQELALEHGMTLRDASAFNVQFFGARPVLIDSLSFERADAGRPWAAYRQFCEHFLGPLALAAYRDPRLLMLLGDLVDGLPLDLATRLLPTRTRFRFGLATHLHLHASAQRKADRQDQAGRMGRGMSEFRHRALVDSLRRTVERLTWEPTTTWSSYGPYTSYGPEAAEAKKHVVREMLELFKGDWVWDLGANTGDFSALAAETGRQVVAIDADHGAAELHYRQLRQSGKIDITSVVGDIGAPTPAVGWNLTERPSLFDRANADVVLALALVHHLAIGGNVPLTKVASVLERLAPHAIVEFVPKEDPQLERMLAAREDVFPDFSLAGFRAALREHFRVVVERPLPDTNRVLFALERHPAM